MKDLDSVRANIAAHDLVRISIFPQKLKKGRNDAQRVKNFLNSEVIFEICDENYPEKIFRCLSNYFRIFESLKMDKIVLWVKLKNKIYYRAPRGEKYPSEVVFYVEE